MGQQAQQLDAGSGGEALHRVGDEVRGLRIDRCQINPVALADEVIFAENTCALTHASDNVLDASDVRPLAHGRATTQMDDQPRSKSPSQLARADLLI